MKRGAAIAASGTALVVLVSGGFAHAQAVLRDAAGAAPQDEREAHAQAVLRDAAEGGSSERVREVEPSADDGPGGEPERPPLSTYDRLRQENDEPLEEERSLTSQLIRTVFALAIVVGLIYLVFKLGLGRLLQGGGVPGLSGKGAREIKVVERTMLDGKNAVIMLELRGDRRILVGTGERGVSYLCDVEPGANGDGAPRDDTAKSSFSDVLEANAKESHEA